MINNVDWSVKYPETNTEKKLIDRIIESRQLDPEDLNKNYNDMYDPFLMNDMDVAVMKIDEARSEKKKVLIYGDYDVDGTTAVKILYTFLRKIGIECDYYIPDRIEEGYGISDEGVDYILVNEYDLVITVDCGVTAIDKIDFLMNMQVDVIVTDHHECKEELPKAIAVIDCKRKDNTYPFSEICGAVVALKLCQALCEEYNMGDTWKELIAYAALGTVADVMPLRDENRIIVIEGLKEIKKTDDIAIKNLLRVAEKLDDRSKLTATDIAFYIAPKINASSRIGDVSTVMTLFLTEDPDIAYQCAEELKALNEKRKEITQQILREANNFLMKDYNFRSLYPIVVYGDGWHKGVIGIVAAKLVELYNKPTIVLTKEENGKFHGSCRTFGNINIMDILTYCASEIEQFGGHEGAAGLTISDQNKLNSFIEKTKEYARLNFTEEDFRKIEEAEMVISSDDITLENAEDLNILEPYGEGNRELVFICNSLKTRQLKKIGKKKGSENAHLKATFVDRKDTLKLFDGIGFYMSDYFDVLPSGKNVDVLFSLSVNEFNGKKTPQLMIKDIHFDFMFPDGATIEESELFHDDYITLEDIYESSGLTAEDLLPTQDDYIDIFKQFKEIFAQPNNEIIITDLNLLTIILSTRIQRELNPFKVERVLEAIDEGGYLNYRKMLFDKIILTVDTITPREQKKKIVQTEIYKKNHNIS